MSGTEENINYVAFVFDCARRDRIPILLMGIVLAFAAAGMALTKPQATSAAQLVLTGIQIYPEDQDEIEDVPARLLAEPLDVKSAVLLCMSDETLERTRTKLGDSMGGASLGALRGSLNCEITIAEESPMDILYSPILRLSARASTPRAAKERVDTWAEVCVERAREYRAIRQGAMAEAYAHAADRLRAAQEAKAPRARESSTLEAAGISASEEAYAEIMRRATYAEVGADGEPSELQILSRGAEWPVSGRVPVAKAAVAGLIAGMLAGLVLSLLLRFAVQAAGPAA